MKKFQFSLDTVLQYKQQRLDALKAEHAAAVQRVRLQEAAVSEAEERYARLNEEYREKKAEGLLVAEAMTYETGLWVIEKQEKLREFQRQAEAKRAEMVGARQETASIEKLREKKLDLYQKDIQKSEERFIDDLVGARQGASLES